MNTIKSKPPNERQQNELRATPTRNVTSLNVTPFCWNRIFDSPLSLWHADGGLARELRSLYADIILQPLPEHICQLVYSLGKAEDRE